MFNVPRIYLGESWKLISMPEGKLISLCKKGICARNLMAYFHISISPAHTLYTHSAGGLLPPEAAGDVFRPALNLELTKVLLCRGSRTGIWSGTEKESDGSGALHHIIKNDLNCSFVLQVDPDIQVNREKLHPWINFPDFLYFCTLYFDPPTMDNMEF